MDKKIEYRGYIAYIEGLRGNLEGSYRDGPGDVRRVLAPVRHRLDGVHELVQKDRRASGHTHVIDPSHYPPRLRVEIVHVLLKKYDAVIGSKRARGARDRRPSIRRLITWGFNTFLRIVFKFTGTDTHGIKALHFLILGLSLEATPRIRWL